MRFFKAQAKCNKNVNLTAIIIIFLIHAYRKLHKKDKGYFLKTREKTVTLIRDELEKNSEHTTLERHK